MRYNVSLVSIFILLHNSLSAGPHPHSFSCNQTVTLADCLFEQLVSQQELLIHRLRPGSANIAGSSGPSMKELANEAIAALIRSQMGEAGLFVSTSKGVKINSVEQGQSVASSADVAYDQDPDQEAKFTIPPNPLAALLTTCFN